jgi:S-adenosylmethionine synthetase
MPEPTTRIDFEWIAMNELPMTVAEWVLPGHPDKLCDALADRIVGEVLRADPPETPTALR